jgi:hypothetical protein
MRGASDHARASIRLRYRGQSCCLPPMQRRRPSMRSQLSRLNTQPTRSPADASPMPSRVSPHGLGSMWFATPSSSWPFTMYSVPVSRRTAVLKCPQVWDLTARRGIFGRNGTT